MTLSLLAIIPAIYDVLFDFAQSDGFWANLETAFGTSYDVVKATQLRQQWQSRDFSQLPEIEVVNSSVLGSANGAYGISTNKIYLSESFFASASLDALVAVILEEIGHFVDAQVNTVDTVGDEGELFSHLVRGVNLTEAELTYIQTEDDRSVIDLGGQFIGVEQAAPITLIVNTTIDENDGSATIGTGLSLRDAVIIANKNSSFNTPYIIKLKSGTTYELTYVNNKTTGDRSLKTQGTITIETDGTALASIVNNSSPIPGQNDDNSIINNSYSKILGVTLNNLYISNKAGRGIYNSDNGGTLTITNSTITGNTAHTGGGIYNAHGKLTLTNSTISGNTAGWGGGGIFSDGTLTITNSTISGNTANGGGGGIFNTGTLTITNSTISGNTANGGGGGIGNFLGTLTITNSTISGNTVDSYGGGIGNALLQSQTLTITNSTISGNTANGGGGGIFNSDNAGNTGTLTLTNNIITSNSAPYGGGIYNTGTWSSNSIISGNTASKVWYIDPDGHSTISNFSGTIYNKIANPIDPKYPNIYDEGTFTALPPTPNPPPKPTISVSNAWVDVPAGTNQTKVLKFEVKLSSAYDKPITVDYYTLDGSANSIDSKQLKDFNNVVKQTLSFFPGQTSKQIEITVLGSAPPTDQTFEILARDTAYRDWTDTDKGKEVDKIYDYSDLGYEGYRINKVFKDSTTGFDAFGLTSDEKFFLVLANPLNANEFKSSSNNLLQDIANTSGGNNTAAYTAGQNLINQLTSTKQSYTFTDGTIYDLAKPPVLAIRGTEFSSVNDLLSDAETEGIGYNQFTNNKAAVNQWLSEVTNPVSGLTLKPNITGHSLGGALSQWVGGSYTGQLGKIVTFNSPGISQQPGINFNATNNLGVTHYITSADLVSIAGSKYLSGVWNLEKYSKLTSAITFEKHSVPVLNQTITRTNLSKPTDLTRKVANGNTTDLSSYWFTYLPDADYFALQMMIRGLGSLPIPGIGLTGTYLAAALTFRGTVELNRQAIGIAINSLGNISDAVTSAYNAAKSWTSDAWDAIIGQSDKKLGLSPSTANQSNSPQTLASSFLDTNSYEIATTATASQTIDNFWDAIPDWGNNAWQATTKWSGDAWKSIDEWTPQTWQATTTWTAADWDKPFFTISNPTIVENNSGTNNLIFKVTLSTTSTQTITVNYATANNTATAGSDYTAKTGTLTFTPGQISQDIIISVNGDTAIEPDETFLINLANPSNALITDNQGLGTITNDDGDNTSVTLAVSPGSVTEDGTTNLVYTFTRTGVTTNPLTVNYTLGGTATLNTDYTRTGTNNTVTFAAGSSTAKVTIDPTADTTVEPDETVTLTIASGTGYTIGTTTPVTGTIKNDDVTLPSITLAVSPSSVFEDGTTNLIYTFTRTGVTTNALTVNYTIGGTATLNTDYTRTGTNNTVTFAAGSSTATVTVDPKADTTVEPDETVTLTIASGTGYTIGTTNAVTGTIKNDDVTLPSITLAVSPSSVTEDGTTNLVYTFTRSGVTTNALTVNYTLGGTATLNTDYTRTGTTNTVTFAAGSSTATVTVDPTADTIVESNETVILTLAAGTGYTVGTPNAATGTITNDDTTVTLAVSPASVTEDGTTNLVYTFTRTGVTTNALTVNYTLGGTATLNTDYTRTGTTNTVTFAAGSSTATVTVDPTADTIVESNETVILTLASGTGYTVGTTTPVTGTITNDDTTVTLAVSPASVTEDGTTNLVYTFTRTGVTTNALTVNYTLGGTATLNNDYTRTGTNNTVTFAAGSSTATVTIDPTPDTIVESNETVILTLATGTGYTVGTTTPVTGTITNSPVPPSITLAVAPSSVTEDGTTNLIYTFTRTGVTTNPLTVNYTLGGTATLNNDYTRTGTTNTVTFAANSATATVTVDPTADTTVESNETVSLTLASGTGYTVGTPNAATGTINNDDTSVTLAVSPASVTEDGTTNLVYTFTRTGVTTNSLTVNYTLGGTATLNTDYTRTGTTNTVTFAAGSSTATVTVDPTADTTVESNETVILTLAAGTGYTVGTTTPVTGTINNDDLSQLSINDITVVEGKDNNAILTVTVDNPNPQPISFNYTTAPINATANVDYTSKTGTITIAPNTSTATISIPILNDNLNEADEAFTVTLSNPVNATINPDEAIGQVIITDTLQSSITRTLPTNVENLRLIGSNNINGTGNAGDNKITGNSGNNILAGANGNDIYCFNASTPLGNDTIQETTTGGIDTLDFTGTNTAVRVNLGITTNQTVVTNNLKLTFSANNTIENIISDSGNDRLTGNSLNNTLTGGGGNDQLTGQDGNDSLIGGSGDDLLTGGNGSDNFIFNSSNLGIDAISDFTPGSDKIVLSKAIFSALQSIIGNGFSQPAEFASVDDDDLVATSSAFIVYSTGSGSIYYNQNGSAAGLGSGSEFANLLTVPTLIGTDFALIN